MKQKIFNRGKGWYVIGNNYKDEKDKAYLDLFFPRESDPLFVPNDRGFSVKDIDIQEAKFTSYKGKIGMTVFKYEEIISETDKYSEDDVPVTEHEELPFY